MKFVQMTQEFYNSLRAALGDRLDAYAPLKELLPIPVVLFPEEDFAKLANGLRLILSAQQKILRALRETHSQDEILSRFSVPAKAWRFIDWKALDAGANVIGRADIVPTRSGEYKFCELNISPAVDGHQMHHYCDPLFRAFGMSMRDFKGGASTYDDLGAMIRRRCATEGRHRVVLLDLDSYHTDGPLVYEEMKRHLEAVCAGYDVHLTKTSQYREEWLHRGEGRKTLVYRLFLEEELAADWDLFEKIVDSGALLLSTFENYVLSSKAWFAIFCDPSFHPLLSPEEVAAIETFVPTTYEISTSNLDELLSKKDGLVFKLSNSCEGRDVLIGSEHSQSQLRVALESRLNEWFAQEFMQALAPELPQTHWTQLVKQNMVLGLYHIDGLHSGLLLRCNAYSRVVNLASGGKASWVLRVTEEEYRTLLDRLAGFHARNQGEWRCDGVSGSNTVL
jgi:hypothetical protein